MEKTVLRKTDSQSASRATARGRALKVLPESFRVDPSDNAPAYQQVQAFLRRLVREGQLVPGQRLPPMRKLCEQLGVSYVTAARGVRALGEEGLLEAKTGAGTRVAATRPTPRGCIGLVGFEPFGELLRHTRYQADILPRLQDEIITHGRIVAYHHCQPGQMIHTMFNDMAMVDGVILLSGHPRQADELRATMEGGTPVIVVGQRFEDADIPSVSTDNSGDAQRVIRWLHRQGHRHIAVMTEPPEVRCIPIVARTNAARHALRMLGLPSDDGVEIFGSPEDQIRQLIQKRPSAVFASTGIKVLADHRDALATAGLTLGEALFPAVYDENLWHVLEPLGIDFLSIQQPLVRIAERTVAWLTQCIDEGRMPMGATRFPAQLIHVRSDGMRERVDE